MVTELQRQFAKSKILRRGLREMLKSEGLPAGRGYKRLWNNITASVFSEYTEAQIKAMLYDFLTCDDLTRADVAEIMHLLQLSSTALTTEQREELAYKLQGYED